MEVDLMVVGAAAVATMKGAARARRGPEMENVGLVPDGAVAIRAGRVVAVGRERSIRSRYRATRTLDAEGGLVTPGFVDPHTHLPFAGHRSFELRLKLQNRSYEQILHAGGGIHHTVKATQAATRGALAALVRERARTMLHWGTTTAEAKSGYGLEWRHERKQLLALRDASSPDGLELVPTFLGAHVLPPKLRGGRKAWVRAIADKMVPTVARGRLARFVDVFLDRGAFTREEARLILEAARVRGLGRKLHADEFTNQRGAQLGAELRAISCDHLLRASKAGIRKMATARTVAVLLPGVAELGFFSRQAPARALIGAKVPVALGTDFNPNCPVLTMPTILQWGVYQLRLSPEEALVACTVNAAAAIDAASNVGRIVPGAQADLLVHRHPSVEELVYWVGPNPVRAVVKRGRIVTGAAA